MTRTANLKPRWVPSTYFITDKEDLVRLNFEVDDAEEALLGFGSICMKKGTEHERLYSQVIGVYWDNPLQLSETDSNRTCTELVY